MISDEARQYMSQLGKKSAVKRQALGHDSEYYRSLARKRWAKNVLKAGEAQASPVLKAFNIIIEGGSDEENKIV
jgi:hypothetical protein